MNSVKLHKYGFESYTGGSGQRKNNKNLCEKMF